ncbi:E3 ubiquitin-protein ligase WAV3 [Rosa sericea]
MGTGWRRAFCTTVPRDRSEPRVSDQKQRSPSPSPSPSPRTRLSFFSSGGSNPSTPRLRCKTGSEALLQKSNSMPTNNNVAESPRVLEIKTSTPKSSNPTSPRSPLKLSLFKNSFKFRSSCGICLNSVKTGQGTAIYTAECSHAFHFPCIASYVRKHGSLVCPVCNSTWKDVPLLAMHKSPSPDSHPAANDTVSAPVTPKPKVEEKKVIAESASPRYTLKPYDDDEPLLSPTVGGRIIPIPEEEEEEGAEDDVEEFQGFFVNPNTSSSVKYSDDPQINNGRDFRNNVQVRLLPEAALLSSGRGFETYAVALTVKAPPAPARQTTSASILDPSLRAPIDLVTVLDVSGSMTGGKIQMLKRAMRLVISSLGEADRLSIVAFSASPKRLMPLKRMTAHGQRAARRIVDRLVCGQGSSAGEALRKATKVLEDRRERNPVASIMLLSDGQDERVNNSGSTNQRHVSNDVSSSRFAHIEIPVHAFGFGQNAGYCQEPAEDAFAKCVGGLLSVVVQDLRVQLGFSSGSAPAEITAIYSCNGRPTVHGSSSIRLGDLYAEEERELLVELRIPTSAAGTHHVMSVRCLYKDPVTQEVVYGKEQGLVVPLTQSAVRSVSSNPKIQRLRSLFITTRAVAESRRLVEHNDFQSAHHLLASTRALLMQSGSASADEYVRTLEAQLAELHWKRQNQLEEQQQQMMIIQRRRVSEREMAASAAVDENGEPLTPTSAWRAAEKLAKVAMMKKSLNRVSDLHGFENARF